MSLTRSRGVFGVVHWTSVSAAVVEYLDYRLGTYEGERTIELPGPALTALQGLLASALKAARDERLEHPEASLNDYLVVREAMRQASATSLERREVARLIGEYNSLLERLRNEPDGAENILHHRDLAVRTRVFLRDLQVLGESERYDHRMRASHPWNHTGDRDWPPGFRGKGC